VCLHAGRYPPPALDVDVECGPRRYHLFPNVASSSFIDDFDVSAKRDERTREDDDDSDDDDTTVPLPPRRVV
jgi:hypothetical protein